MKTLLIFALLKIGVNDLLPETNVSWYGNQFHGRKTASGEIFDTLAFTCASPHLKFKSKVRLTNIANNKSVTVIVNDRGPFLVGTTKPNPKRLFDLSPAAFKQIANPKRGKVRVRFEVIGKLVRNTK